MQAVLMFEFYEKRRLKRMLYAPVTLALMCVPCGYLAWAAWNSYLGERETALKRQEVADELRSLEEREAALVAHIDAVEDPRGIEGELREKFEVGREGEHAVVLVDKVEEDAVVAEAPKKPSVWERIFDIVR